MKSIQTIRNSLTLLKPWTLLLLVTFAALFIYTVNLGQDAFVDYDEAAYAEVVSETVQTRNPFTFTFADEPWFDKPPLYFWAAILSEKIINPLSTIGVVGDDGKLHPSELAMRFPSAIAGVISIILIWLIVFEKTRNKKIAFVAGIILLSTGTFIENVRQVRLDVPVTAAILFTFYSYIRARRDPKWNIGIWSGLAIGIMIKSVLGLLVLPIILFDLLVNDEYSEAKEKVFNWFRGRYAKLGGLIAFILVVPWHLYQTILYGWGFWNHYILIHVLKRFDTNLFPSDISYADFFGWFTMGALPWSVVFIIFLPLCFLPRFFTDTTRFRMFLSATISSVFIFSIFALARTKAPSYLVPLYPFVAIAVTMGMEAIRHHYFKEHHAKHLATLLTVTASVVIILIAIATSVSVGFRRTETLQTQTTLAEQSKIIGLKTFNSSSSMPVYFPSNEPWESVRFYSGGRRVGVFDRENSSSTEDYFVVTTRNNLAKTLNSPAIKFAADFKVEYLGKQLALIRVDNEAFLSTSTER